MADIEYQCDLEGITPRRLKGFFVDWPSPPDPQTHLRILKNSYAIELAVDTGEDRVIGFANAISDGVLTAYIPLLEVLPEWFGQGIGSRLIQRLCRQLDDLYMIDLCCDAQLESFYEPLGFHKSTGMVRRNYEHQAGRPPQDYED